MKTLHCVTCCAPLEVPASSDGLVWCDDCEAPNLELRRNSREVAGVNGLTTLEEEDVPSS